MLAGIFVDHRLPAPVEHLDLRQPRVDAGRWPKVAGGFEDVVVGLHVGDEVLQPHALAFKIASGLRQGRLRPRPSHHWRTQAARRWLHCARIAATIASVYRTGLGATTRMPLAHKSRQKAPAIRYDLKILGDSDRHQLRQVVVVGGGLKPEVIRKKMIMAIHELGGFRVC